MSRNELDEIHLSLNATKFTEDLRNSRSINPFSEHY